MILADSKSPNKNFSDLVVRMDFIIGCMEIHFADNLGNDVLFCEKSAKSAGGLQISRASNVKTGCKIPVKL